MCQIDVSYRKSLIIDFLDDFLKKRTAIMYYSINCTLIPQLNQKFRALKQGPSV